MRIFFEIIQFKVIYVCIFIFFNSFSIEMYQFVASIKDSIMATYHVDSRIIVIMVIKTFTPFLRLFARE